MTRYEMSYTEYNELMRRLGKDYSAMSDLVAYHDPMGSYEKLYIVSGTEKEQLEKGWRAATRNGSSAAVVKIYPSKDPWIDPFTHQGVPSKVVLETDDPKIMAEINKMGLMDPKEQLRADENKKLLSNFSMQVLSLLTPKDVLKTELNGALASIRKAMKENPNEFKKEPRRMTSGGHTVEQ